MVSLLDIAPITGKVKVGEQELELRAITVRDVAVILARFPEVQKAFSGKDVDVSIAMREAPEAVAAAIACGVGKAGEEEYEQHALNALSPEYQMDILQAILRLTLPRGFGPFVEKLNGLAADVSGKVPVTKSPKQSKD